MALSMNVDVSHADPATGEWAHVDTLGFPAITHAWLSEGRAPTPEESLPRRSVTLPSGDAIELGLVFEAASGQTNLYVFEGGRHTVLLMSTGFQCAIFTTRSGSAVQVAACAGET